MEAPIMVPFKIGITAFFFIVVLGYRIVYIGAQPILSPTNGAEIEKSLQEYEQEGCGTYLSGIAPFFICMC